MCSSDLRASTSLSCLENNGALWLMAVVRESRIAVEMVLRAGVFIMVYQFSTAVGERGRAFGPGGGGGRGRTQSIRAAVSVLDGEPDAEGQAIGEKLDKSLDLHYIREVTQICKSL